jgi:putative ABC transport system permease protein
LDGSTHDPDVYLPFGHSESPAFNLVLHTAIDSRSLGQSVRHLVATLDPTIPVAGLRTIEDRIAHVSANQRFSAQLVGAFAVTALGLAAIGLYGIVAFAVSQRAKELGIRMALGAAPHDIVRLILGGTSRLVATGLLCGLVLAGVLARFIETLLYSISAHDPLTYAIVASTLAVIAAGAAWLPARHAAKIDPVIALRAE